MPTERRTRLRAATLATLFATALAPPAIAHGLRANVHVVGDHLVVKATYLDNTPAVGAEVTASDEDHQRIAHGHIDDNGEFQFHLHSIPSDLTIRVDAGGGHATTQTVSDADLTGLVTRDDECKPKTSVASGEPTRIALGRVEAQLENIQQQLSELRQKRRALLDSAVNGLAFIIGGTGVAAYIMAHRRTPS